IVERGEVFTEGLDGEYFDENGIVYWRRRFEKYKIEYLQDYPNCKKMVEYRKLKRKSTWNNTMKKRRYIEKKRKEIENERRGSRFWRPLTFYFYGFGAEIVRNLFWDELYDKPDMKKNKSTWWNGYEEQDI
ncbi:3_t:CDS:2, partial [Scutellospora calospora]